MAPVVRVDRLCRGLFLFYFSFSGRPAGSARAPQGIKNDGVGKAINCRPGWHLGRFGDLTTARLAGHSPEESGKTSVLASANAAKPDARPVRLQRRNRSVECRVYHLFKVVWKSPTSRGTLPWSSDALAPVSGRAGGE